MLKDIPSPLTIIYLLSLFSTFNLLSRCLSSFPPQSPLLSSLLSPLLLSLLSSPPLLSSPQYLYVGCVVAMVSIMPAAYSSLKDRVRR